MQQQDVTNIAPETVEAGLFDQDKQTLSATGLDVTYDSNDNVISLKIPATGIFDRKSIVSNIKKLLDDDNITDKSKHMIRNSVMSCFKINPEDLIKPTVDEFIDKLSDKLDESEVKIREMGFDPHKDWKENISQLSANQILTKKQQDLVANSKDSSSQEQDNYNLTLEKLFTREDEDAMFDSLEDNSGENQSGSEKNNDHTDSTDPEVEKSKKKKNQSLSELVSNETYDESGIPNTEMIESERESEDPE